MGGELETGAVVGSTPYVIVSLLGIGGMGVVYRARNTQDDKLYAIKVLRKDDQTLEARFGREARIASALGHPNIATVHDIVHLDDGSPAIVMELLEGESLGARLARMGKLTAPSIARIARSVVSAIKAAHARGVVHRDLKPDNIFLCEGEDGAVKVLDFGIAKVSVEATDPVITAAPLTDTGQILGTPQYMAPEQIFGEKDIDARADIWALGVILYQALAGVRPFDGENPGQVFKAIALEPPVPLSKHAPRAPKELLALIENRMLVHARSERLADLDEVTRILDRVIVDDQLGAAATIQDVASPSTRASSVRWTTSRIAWMVGGAGLLLAGIAYVSKPNADIPTPLAITSATPSASSAPLMIEESVPSASSSAPPEVVAPSKPPPAKIAAMPIPRIETDSGSAPPNHLANAQDAGSTAGKTNRSGPLKRDEF